MTTDSARDLVIINANIYSQDPALPRAQAIAAKQGRIAAVGSNAEVLAFAGRELPQAAVSDLHEGPVVLLADMVHLYRCTP